MLIESIAYLHRAVGKFVTFDASGFNLQKIALHWKRWGQDGGGVDVSEDGARLVVVLM